MIWGVDLGYGYTKATDGERSVTLPSVAGHKVPLHEGVENGHTAEVTVKGQDYYVGEAALQSPVQYQPLRDDKTDEDTTEVMLHAALLGLAQGHERVSLVTGLPVDHYWQQRDDVLSLMGDSHRVRSNGHALNIRVERKKVVPQPLGALLDEVLDAEGRIVSELAEQTVTVVDIGYYTLDILTVRGLAIQRNLSWSVNVGMATAYREIARSLGGIPIHEVDRRIRTGAVKGHREILEAVAKKVEEQAQQACPGVFLIAGGGGRTLYPMLFNQEKRMLANNPQMANVRGFLKLGRRLWTS